MVEQKIGMSSAPEAWVVAAIAAFLIGMAKGGLANVGVIAVPLMSLVKPPLTAAGLLLPIYVVSDAFGVWLYRHRYSASNLRILIPSGFFGVLIGWLLAGQISDAIASVIVGFTGCGFVAVLLARRGVPSVPRQANVPKGWFLGVATGFTSFLTHSGAATFQMFVLPQRLDKTMFAGTSTLTFAAINLFKIPSYWALGQLSTSSVMSALVLIPVAVAGTFAGVFATRRLSTSWFFILVQAMLLVVSIQLLWRGMSDILN
nr:putative permease [Novosphingobium resinovorum]